MKLVKPDDLAKLKKPFDLFEDLALSDDVKSMIPIRDYGVSFPFSFNGLVQATEAAHLYRWNGYIYMAVLGFQNEMIKFQIQNYGIQIGDMGFPSLSTEFNSVSDTIKRVEFGLTMRRSLATEDTDNYSHADYVALRTVLSFKTGTVRNLENLFGTDMIMTECSTSQPSPTNILLIREGTQVHFSDYILVGLATEYGSLKKRDEVGNPKDLIQKALKLQYDYLQQFKV